MNKDVSTVWEQRSLGFTFRLPKTARAGKSLRSGQLFYDISQKKVRTMSHVENCINESPSLHGATILFLFLLSVIYKSGCCVSCSSSLSLGDDGRFLAASKFGQLAQLECHLDQGTKRIL